MMNVDRETSGAAGASHLEMGTDTPQQGGSRLDAMIVGTEFEPVVPGRDAAPRARALRAAGGAQADND